MAGGEGSRLRPITANRPKPMAPVVDRPIMEHILGLLKRHNITEVVITVHYLADEIEGYFGDGTEFGMSLRYSVEDTPLGTAGSVKKAQSLIGNEPFLIISGDGLTDCDLTAAIAHHRATKAMATLVLSQVENPLDYGLVMLNESGRIERFLEKPTWGQVFSNLANTGIYILEPAVLDRMENGKRYDWSENIFPGLLRDGEALFGYIHPGFWCDIGSLDQYRDAHIKVLQQAVQIPIEAKQPEEGIWVGEGAIVDPTAILHPPLYIGRYARVKAGAAIGPYTSIGDHSTIEEGASVERSVLWESVYIGAEAQLQSTIVGARAVIKRDCVLREGSVIGDRCLLDVGASVKANIKLWPDKVIERGATVTMSLIWGNKWRGNLFRELGAAGLSNVEITPDFAVKLGSAYGSCFTPHAKIVTSRDSTRSSRMIKRAVISSLLSVGCDVVDLRSAPVMVARHYIKASAAQGAIHVRKLPGNARVTLIELLDSRGAYVSRNVERKVENAFYREDFNRMDSDDIGVIEFGARAIEEYQADFLRRTPALGEKSLRVVVDYGFSSLGSLYPSMLSQIGVESISLNGFGNAKLAPRSGDQVKNHVENLRNVVRSLDYDLGVLFLDDGERLLLIDDQGELIEGYRLLGALASLLTHAHPGAAMAFSSVAPDRVVQWLEGQNANVLRSKVDQKSLLEEALVEDVRFVGDGRGGFAFPEFHPGFDGAFAFAQLVSLLSGEHRSLSEVVAEVPRFALVERVVDCPWEAKGQVMRTLVEELQDRSVTMFDGIRRTEENGWSLAVPALVEPWINVFAEGEDTGRADQLADAMSDHLKALVARFT